MLDSCHLYMIQLSELLQSCPLYYLYYLAHVALKSLKYTAAPSSKMLLRSGLLTFWMISDVMRNTVSPLMV